MLSWRVTLVIKCRITIFVINKYRNKVFVLKKLLDVHYRNHRLPASYKKGWLITF